MIVTPERERGPSSFSRATARLIKLAFIFPTEKKKKQRTGLARGHRRAIECKVEIWKGMRKNEEKGWREGERKTEKVRNRIGRRRKGFKEEREREEAERRASEGETEKERVDV